MGNKVSLFSLVSIDLYLLPEAIGSFWTLLTFSYEFRKLKKKKRTQSLTLIIPAPPSLKKCIVAIHDLIRNYDFRKN